jgi:hypothetical protein
LVQASAPAPPHPRDARRQRRLQSREVRSFELDHVNGLWHLDFHRGSRSAYRQGIWVTPMALAVLDDRSRLCHVQWYLDETARAGCTV